MQGESGQHSDLSLKSSVRSGFTPDGMSCRSVGAWAFVGEELASSRCPVRRAVERRGRRRAAPLHEDQASVGGACLADGALPHRSPFRVIQK